MMVVLVLLLILLSGRLVVLPRSDGLRREIGLFCLGRLIFGLGSWIAVAATPITISAKIITVLTRYRPIVFELI